MWKYINLTKYAKIVNSGSEYSQRMKHLSNRIFGEITRPTTSKSMKVIKCLSEEPYYLRRDVIKYYPRHVETGKIMRNLREFGLFRDEHQDFREEMYRLREMRGKGRPPKKTKEEGKRWKKKQQKLAEEAAAAANN